MKFILATIPIRPKPATFPPVGSTSLLNTLACAGFPGILYDIDGLRPDFEEVVEYFKREKPDILGISAVVSTAYSYVKKLTLSVRQVSPKTKIILGGCLAASAELLLRRCLIDICVIGEGEKILLNLIKHWDKFGDFVPDNLEFQRIKGIAYLNADNNLIFTGFEEQLLPAELPQPDYELLERFSKIENYIHDPMSQKHFFEDKRAHEPRRQGEKACFVMTGKGCYSHCAFCHRWIAGYRAYPTVNVANAIKTLKEKYNVGFFIIGDESFGADIRELDGLIEAIRPLDILFIIGGIRISTAYARPDLIRKLYEAGCVQMNFGLESGSDKILSVMGKGVTRKQNIEVGRLLVKENMCSTHQLVVGLPGENNKTIFETIDCLKQITEDMPRCPDLSINYFQALPGTPGYEYLKHMGIIEPGLEAAEKYLLSVSNINANDWRHYRNLSEECLSSVILWPYLIKLEVGIHWYQKHGWRKQRLINELLAEQDSSASLFYRMLSNRTCLRIISWFFRPFLGLLKFAIQVRLYGIGKAILLVLGKQEDDRSRFIVRDGKPLRVLLPAPNIESLSISERNLLPLRFGR